MAVKHNQRVCNGLLLKLLAAAGLAWLEEHREHVDRLNVFPVPDGDTGKNMLLTMRSAYQEIAEMEEPEVGIVGDGIAHGALMGARGNSGVILSQLWQGFASTLRNHKEFDARMFAKACRAGVTAAYKSVGDPVEGTILTVARETCEAVEAFVQKEDDLVGVLDVMVSAAKASLQRTPELLPVLKQAGVVDSGGQGFVYILEGMQRVLRGETVMGQRPIDEETVPEAWQEALLPEDEEGYGYDVQFLMHGTGMDVKTIREEIDAMGWSTLVVGNDRLIKVHVHVHDPGEPISYAIRLGTAIDDIVVENMQRQYEAYVEERMTREGGASDDSIPDYEIAVIAVASGNGIQELFKRDFHASYIISGGQTMNPSTQDFLDAIQQIKTDKIILLPNNKNIIMAAKQAATMAEGKQVIVVPSRSIPQGIAAMLPYVNAIESGDLEVVAAEMEETLQFVTSAEVTVATRDAEIDQTHVRAGQYIGLLNGKLVAADDDINAMLTDLLQKANADEYELITLYYGDDVQTEEMAVLSERLSAHFEGPEFEFVLGGQPLYPYIISIE
jgi:DAK2 domain fusion protein YloV